MARDAAEIALCFESLGGGSLNRNGWAFGCEFGFWQRSLGLEPLGFLRWSSISPKNLLNGLEAGFAGVEDPKALEMREHTGHDWGATQTTYGMYLDHSHLNRAEVSAEKARRKIVQSLGFLRNKLIDDLAKGEKLFVYRTYDHTLDESSLRNLEKAVARYGNGVLCYVQHCTEDHPVFTAQRRGPNLIVGYIDRFAPRQGSLDYNPIGWELVCRAMLSVW